ncbi:MAG TPA: DUF4126 domain-containing protein [Candidatus Eisenbacteria bacterium]
MTADALVVRDLVFAAAAGTAIAAACGLRAFLPLLALALGVRFGLLHVAPSGAWIGSTPAIVTLVWATVLELAADKIPALDHALDLVATVLRPLAAAVAAWCTFVGVHPAIAVAAAVLFGTGAMGVHVTKAKVRLGSSIVTLGAANPLISFVEDALATGLSAMAVLAPVAALVGVGLLAWAMVHIFRARQWGA